MRIWNVNRFFENFNPTPDPLNFQIFTIKTFISELASPLTFFWQALIHRPRICQVPTQRSRHQPLKALQRRKTRCIMANWGIAVETSPRQLFGRSWESGAVFAVLKLVFMSLLLSTALFVPSLQPPPSLENEENSGSRRTSCTRWSTRPGRSILLGALERRRRRTRRRG